MIGQTLGHYRIEAKLGEGGMGVVYRAFDIHLDRAVAIKVLRPDAVANPERRQRFVQEAKAASALNHPNILHIYDIDQSDGTDFIAMEYVPGKTLEQLIGRRGLPLGEALKYAVQIADALAKAHSAGIVHRDLKPANVMVTSEGLVKLLDFGLAKLTETIEGDEFAPTETLKTPPTEEGTIVGTVAYMSPEQAEGKKVDARSDIFSFGSVLYEMATGRRAFQGQTKISTLSAILHKEPPPIEGAPSELERIITRCLRKEPERRSHHMDDVKLALQELKEESESGRLAVAAPPPRPRPWLLPALIIIGVLLAAVAGAWIWRLARAPEPVPTPTLTRLTSDSGLTTEPALSPDGRLLAYASDRSGEGNLDIYVRQVGGGEPIRLTRDPADDHEPAFSPDGTQIAFRSEREGGGIYVVSALGGPARKITPEGRRPQFSPDGNWIAYWVGKVDGASFSARNCCRTYVVASAGGMPKQVQPDFAGAAYPIWSPGGTHLLFLGNRDNKVLPEDSVDWWVTPLDPGPAIRTGALEATKGEKLAGPLGVYPWALLAPRWGPDGGSLVFSARSGDSTNLWRIGISPKTWKVAGHPQRLTSGPTLEENPSVASGPGGTVRAAFASVSENVNIWSLPVEANQGKVGGEPQRLTLGTVTDFHPALSPDGSRMAFISTRSGNQEVWVKDLRSGEESALTASRSNKWEPQFSPDGSKVSFASIENKKWNVYVVPATGGPPELICDDCGAASDWSLDGKRILGNDIYGRVWLLDLASRHKTELLADPNHWLCCARLSPDNRWIAFLARAAGSVPYIAPFQGEAPIGKSAWVAVADGASKEEGMFLWSPDGKLVYGFSDRDGFECIWAQGLDPVRKRPLGDPFAIFHSHSARRSPRPAEFRWMPVRRDKIVFNMVERTGNIWMAEWKERR